MKKYWVGVLKGKYEDHEVVKADEPTPEEYPQFQYMVGPFDTKKKATARAKTEKNQDGMFHPFPGHPR